MKSTVHACVPLNTTNKDDEQAVAIWGTEESVTADGKTETHDLHEVWWFNKDGKIVAMRQWNAKFTK